MAAGIYRLIEPFSLPLRVWLLRLFTLAIASSVVPLSYCIARKVFDDKRLALGAAIVVAVSPELLILVCRVSNDCLAIALAAVCILFGLAVMDSRGSRWSAAKFGMALGCALLTKAYLLALIPFAAASFYVSWRKRGSIVSSACIALVIALAIGGWWYLGTWLHTGSTTGEQTEVAALNSSGMSLWNAATRISWIRVADFVATSYIWLGGWSFLVLRSWMYRIVEIVFFAGAVGCVVALIKNASQRLTLLALLTPCFAFLCGLGRVTKPSRNTS